MFYLKTCAYTDKLYALEAYIMYGHALEAVHEERLTRLYADDVFEYHIAPIGEELVFLVLIRSADTCTAVGIARLKQDSVLADTLHDDVHAPYILAPAATTGSGLKTAAYICSVKHTVFDYQSLHATRELRTDNEASVCTIDGILDDEEIALRTGLYAFLAYAAFHTYTVVTGAHSAAGY